MVPVVVAHGGAGFVVGAHVGQFVVGAEGLARGARADAAGDVQFLAGDVVPDLVERVDVGRIAGERAPRRPCRSTCTWRARRGRR